MKKYVCNPMNLNYKFQTIEMYGRRAAFREAADPSAILFKGKYYLFPSMSAGFWASDDLASWEFHEINGPKFYGYAPDVCAVGDYLYIFASETEAGNFCYRTKDPLSGEFEVIKLPYSIWDPNLFSDDDGRLYLYFGCSNDKPVYGVELNPDTLAQIGQPVALIEHDKGVGFERIGDDHILKEPTNERERRTLEMVGSSPFIEGAWMTKHNGKYYLQYATPGTEYNTYADGYYVSDKPLGPYRIGVNNPYSYKPGGFVQGAGHGSTLKDKYGNYWHFATNRISTVHPFERRISMFPAGFDEDGVFFCNQRFGDYPVNIVQDKLDPWAPPEHYLLSYGKKAFASSSAEGFTPDKAVDENIRTFWRAEKNNAGEWLAVDLGGEYDVQYVQLNFYELNPDFVRSEKAVLANDSTRHIERTPQTTDWVLQGSLDGQEYFEICNSSGKDLPHDFVFVGKKLRFIKCIVRKMPYNQPAGLCGLRVFGKGNGNAPDSVQDVKATRSSGLDAEISWTDTGAFGYNVLWGVSPEKLYHSYTVYEKCSQHIGALIEGQSYYIRIDAFNENGVTEGKIIYLK